MPVTIKAPNGDDVEFPDGTDDATIERAMGETYGTPSAPAKNTPVPAYTGQAGEVIKKGDTLDNYLSETGRNVKPGYEGLSDAQKAAWQQYGQSGDFRPGGEHGSREYPVMQVDNAELPGGTWYFDAEGALNQVPVKENFALGFLEGGAKPINNVLHWGSNAAQAAGVPEGVAHNVGGFLRNPLGGITGAPPLMNQDQIDQLVENARQVGTRPSGAGELAGSVAAAAPTIPLAMAAAPEAGAVGIGAGIRTALASPFTQGAVQGALNTENPDDLQSVATDAALGAATGKAGDVGMRAVGSAIAPVYREGVQRLAQRGVRMTPGEILGGPVQKIEDAALGVPIIGDVVGSAKNRGRVSFNTAAYNDVAEPLGINMRGVRPGREAIRHLQTEVGDRYDQLIPSLSFRADRALATDLNDLNQHVLGNMQDQYQRNWRNLMRDRAGRLFDPQGNMAGADFKDLESHMGKVSRDFMSSQNPFDREYGQVVREALESIRDNVARTNPQAAAELQTLNNAYSHLATIENASIDAGAHGGVFTPEQYNQAMKQAMKGVTRRKTLAGGAGRNQQITEDAMDVMGSKIHETGSMTRGAVTMGAGALALGLIPKGLALNPIGLGILGAGLAPYAPGTSAVVRNAMISRPAGAAALRRAVTSLPARSIAVDTAANIRGAKKRTDRRKHVE